MGSAPSARGIQPGGSGRPFRCVSDPLWGPPPGRARPPPGAFPPAAVRRDRLWVGLEGLGGEGGYPLRRRALQRPSAPTSPFPGDADIVPPRPLSPRGGTGPPVPDAAVDRAGLSSVRARPRRAARAGTGPRHGRSGSAAKRLPTRPVLKHGPRSLTHARVKGPEKPHGAMKVKAGARRA